MQLNSTNNTLQGAQTDSATRFTPIVLSALLGLALLFVAGFAETSVFHNAAHDSRHSAVFPCH
ncbi:MAG TPA: CbtB-domain containing protein [Candidatus Tenderia sp.]|nr:CbtB-domain containing protein [Candidatus Tenderia sp.]